MLEEALNGFAAAHRDTKFRQLAGPLRVRRHFARWGLANPIKSLR